MALPGKENPFAKGLSERPPSSGMNEKKSFIKIPLSTGNLPDTIKENSPNLNTFAHVAFSATAVPAIADSAIAQFTTAAFSAPRQQGIKAAMVNYATAESAIEEDMSHKATRAEYAAEKDTIAKLADKKSGYTRIDNFVFDALIPKIGSASASIVYLYLWRRSLGFQRPSVFLSHQIISESVGLSKRAVQEAILKLNELNVIKTKRAYETAIPEHFIIPFKGAESTESAIAENAIEDPAIAKNGPSYSKIYHSAIAESATTKRKGLKKEINSLSHRQVPKPWKEFTAQLTEKARERAEQVFQSLIKQYPDEQMDEIAECPKNLERFGAPDGTPWTQIKSPVGLMESSWPQLREFFRKQIGERDMRQAKRQQVISERLKIEAEEKLLAEEQQRREKVFLKTFPAEQERQEVIKKYIKNSPFRADMELGKRMAIEMWWDETERSNQED